MSDAPAKIPTERERDTESAGRSDDARYTYRTSQSILKERPVENHANVRILVVVVVPSDSQPSLPFPCVCGGELRREPFLDSVSDTANNRRKRKTNSKDISREPMP